MRFSHMWTEDDTTYYDVTFSLEELQAAAAATGLDVQAFRGMHVFHHDDGEHRLDGDREDPAAVAYIEPLVLDALKRRDEAFARRSAWHTAKRQGWQVLDAAGAAVTEPTFDDGRW